jgi:hypothetical protein
MVWLKRSSATIQKNAALVRTSFTDSNEATVEE